MSRKSKIVGLFLTFLKIGAFTFGGGYAMIPLIQREICEKRKWIAEQDIMDIIAIAESTPGPIAINSATFVGYKVCGFWGSFVATAGIVLPSFIIISLISMVISQFEQLKPVKYAFIGIRAGVLALIIKAFLSMYKQCPKNTISYIVAALAFVLVAVFDLNVLLVIICSGAIGLISSLWIRRRVAK
ncbi:MAG: chromate transporter [Ruminococcaceae bacterium]|nr:chromate transporter [Oscillospiraceae bacterium]